MKATIPVLGIVLVLSTSGCTVNKDPKDHADVKNNSSKYNGAQLSELDQWKFQNISNPKFNTPLQSWKLEKGDYKIHITTRYGNPTYDKGTFCGFEASVVIDEITIQYKSEQMPVPRCIYSDLGSIRRCSIDENGSWATIFFNGSDAGDLYSCKIDFDEGYPQKRTVTCGDDPDSNLVITTTLDQEGRRKEGSP